MIPAKSEPKKATKPAAAPAGSNGHPVGVLLREEGAYKAGLRVTTDPARPSDPKGREPVRVDAGRFDAWAKSGAFERIEKPPVESPPAPLDETPQENSTKSEEED